MPWLVSWALAHPSADERFERRVAEVPEAGPGCVAEVWLERARALGAEGRGEEALAAVDRAESCGAGGVDQALARGLLLGPHRPAEALPHLDAVLRVEPTHAGALAARASVHEALGHTSAAVVDLSTALALSSAPSPDDVLRLARLLDAGGDHDGALAAIDAAPPSPALVEQAVAIELALGRPEAALGRLEAMPDTPYWWSRRAQVELP